MSLCVVLNADGTLTPLVDPVGDCPGYILVDAAEWTVSQFFNGLATVPPASSLLSIFVWGVTLPVLFGFIAWGLGQALSLFKVRDGE